MLVGDSFVAFVDRKKTYVRWTLLFDEGFEIDKEELKDKIKSLKEFTISDQNQ